MCSFFGGGCGADRPDKESLAITARQHNQSCSGYTIIRPGGPLFIGVDPHGLSEPALHTALEVLVARLRRKIEARGGTVVERVESRGLAPLGKEDPMICRLVVSWSKR